MAIFEVVDVLQGFSVIADGINTTELGPLLWTLYGFIFFFWFKIDDNHCYGFTYLEIPITRLRYRIIWIQGQEISFINYIRTIL